MYIHTVCLSYREECLGNIKGDLLGYRIYYIRLLCHRRLEELTVFHLFHDLTNAHNPPLELSRALRMKVTAGPLGLQTLG
jgi:hypothetical protein